jgi:hypothetical protein
MQGVQAMGCGGGVGGIVVVVLEALRAAAVDEVEA